VPGALEVPCCCVVATPRNSGSGGDPSLDSHACIIVCRHIVRTVYAVEGSRYNTNNRAKRRSDVRGLGRCRVTR
jgi:hypothetical protein